MHKSDPELNGLKKAKKNTKYFLNLENNRQTQKSIIKLYDSKGVLLTDQTDILNRQKEIYANLYTTKTPNIDNITSFIENIKLESKLSDEDGEKCEGVLTEAECFSLLLIKSD